MTDYDHVILGCGVAGLCAAHMLLEAGAGKLLILDEYPAPGGNQISDDVNGYTFDIGAFYYWPSMPMFQMYPAMAAACLQVPIVIKRIAPSGGVCRYPFSFGEEFFGRGPLYWGQALTSMASARLSGRPFTTAEDFAVYWMGQRLYTDLGMAAYIERFFGLPANQIEAQFAVSRMEPVARIGKPSYWLDKGWRSVKNLLPFGRHVQPEVLMVRPEEGMAFMYGKAVTALRERQVVVRLGERLGGIRKHGKTFEVLTDHGPIRTERLIATVPVKLMAKHLDIPAGQELASVDLMSLFVSFDGAKGFDANILYNWGRTGRWKRLTMHSGYYGRRNGRDYASIEVPLFRTPGVCPNAMFADFCRSVTESGLFRGDLKLEGHRLVENAYPANTLGASAKAAEALAAIKQLGVQTLGRQGRFDYLPTGEHVAKQVAQHLAA